MLVKLTHDTTVRFPKDTVLEVADDEGKRLMAFLLAEEVKEKKKETKKKGK